MTMVMVFVAVLLAPFAGYALYEFVAWLADRWDGAR